MLDGTKILRETWGNNILKPLYDNEDSVCGIVYNDVPYYFQKNLQGDIIAIVDKNAETIARYTYDAWGKVTVLNAQGVDISDNKIHIANINPFRYRGYYFDNGTNLYYLQSRYYDAQVGRFVNEDMIEIAVFGQNVLSHNLFAYCENEPIFNCDFSGYASIKICANGSFDEKYENQISNSTLYKKIKAYFSLRIKKM